VNNISVVILDDDILARNSIKELLENSTYEVIKEFQDPEIFLQWIQNNEVDILLCDMKMPKLNGVELIEKLRVSHKYLSIIAISSFDDFEFARGCLLYGVEDYLLKSKLNKKRIINVLNRVCAKNQIVLKQQNVFTNCFEENEIITLESVKIRSNIDYNINSVSPILISLRYPIIDSNDYQIYRKDNFKALIDIINQTLQNNYPYVLQIENNNLISLYLSFTKENHIESLIKRIIKNFVEKVQRKSKRLLDLSVMFAIGENSSFEDCYKKRNDRISKMDNCLYLKGDDDLIIDLNISNEAIIKGYIFKEQTISILNYAIESGNEDLYNEVFDFIFDEMYKKQISKSNLIAVSKKIFENIGFDYTNIVNQIDNIYNLKIFIKNLYSKVLREKINYQKNKYTPSIYQLMLYIIKNYQQDYSLFEYAEKMHLSYTHLSRMFKNETGYRFSEYSNQIKVNQAKLLLLKETYSIKYITEKTGFKGYNYFFKVFKDFEEVTPIEYIAKNCSN